MSDWLEPLQIKINDIHCDLGTQTRTAISSDTVACYAEAMASGDVFPPVDVFHDGTRYVLADGFHRVMAVARNDGKEIACNVHKGTVEDALWFSLGANTTNGLYRSRSDKQRCIEIALRKFPDRSDSAIAEHCRVSHHTVAERRKKMENDLAIAKSPKRVGKDGRKCKPPTRKPKVKPPDPKHAALPPADADDSVPEVPPAGGEDALKSMAKQYAVMLEDIKSMYLALPAPMQREFCDWLKGECDE